MDYKTEAAEYQARKRRIAEARSVRRRKRRNARKQARESLTYLQQWQKHEQQPPPTQSETQSSPSPGQEVATTPVQG